MQARTCTSSSSSIRATGMPSWIVSITESTAPSIVSNAQVADAITSGMPKSLQRHLGDHAERALAADEEPRQVVARRRLPRPAAGPDDAAVAEDDRQAEDVLAHRPVAHRVVPDARVAAMPPIVASAPGSTAKKRPSGARRCARASRVSPASTRQSRSALLTSSTLVIPREIDADPAAQRADVAFERGAGAERDHGNPSGGAGADHVRHLLGRLREEDGIGRSRRVVRLVPPVQVENGLARGDARAVARTELLDDAGGPLMHLASSLAA